LPANRGYLNYIKTQITTSCGRVVLMAVPMNYLSITTLFRSSLPI
jgi:hypothetical protein